MKEGDMSLARKDGFKVKVVPKPSGQPRADHLRAPLVSIIVTNFNYEKFIGQCLQSAVNQTYKNIEIVVVDDVSTDKSVERIREFIRTDTSGHSCRLLKLEKNGGQMNAFSEGLKITNGTFVVFLDADDLLFPDFVETHVRAHLNPEYVAGLTCSNEVLIDQDNHVLASSIELWNRHRQADYRLAPGVPVQAVRIEDWKDCWDLGDADADSGAASGRSMIADRSLPLLFIEPDDNQQRVWLWSTTSAVMFRRSVLDVALTQDVLGVRICADYFLFHFCHLIGGTILIDTPHGAYRRHGSNNFARNLTIGRGTRVAGAIDHQNTVRLNDLIEATVRDRYDQLLDLAGEPRMLQILAHVTPLTRLHKALRIVGKRQMSVKVQFLLLYAIRYLGRKIHNFRKKLRFAL